jgi:MFS family permease
MSHLNRIPRGVWVLGFVSMFMDMSSELIHSLLPVFMVSALGASVMVVGIIEGIAESAALIVKVFSGMLSDWLGRRKGLTVFGYGLSALSKPAFALAGSIYGAFFARFLDRIGKGIRGAPRDALVADMVPIEIRGAAYGLRQSLDTVGAFVGPALAIILMMIFAGDFRQVFWFATIPAFLAVGLLIAGIREPDNIRAKGELAPPIEFTTLKQFSGAYWWIVTIGGFFTLARFSEAFLILRAQGAGLPDVFAPAILIVMNIVYALSAYPAGKLADRMDRNHLMLAGLLVLMLADFLLAWAQSLAWIFAGVVLWGLHMGMTQGLLATMIADAAPAKLRGSGFGVYYLISGIAMLFASVLAGIVWDIYGAAMTFYCGAGFAAISLVLLMQRRIK